MTKAYIAGLFVLFGILSFLVLITRGQRALVKKKILLGALILSLTGTVTAAGCRSGDARDTRERDVWSFEGWVDDHTFRVIAMGPPRQGLTNSVHRKESARQAAILYAQYQAIEKFKPRVSEACAGMADYSSTGYSETKEISGIIKGGSIVAIKYDEEQNCRIVFDVKALNLKKRISERSGY